VLVNDFIENFSVFESSLVLLGLAERNAYQGGKKGRKGE
jgi:hypothetical protein